MAAAVAEVLLVSAGARATRGGIFALDGTAFEKIDPIGSQGLHYAHGRLVRALDNGPKLNTSELLVYDDRGAQQWLRVNSLRASHDVLVREDGYLAVRSDDNSIVKIGHDGSLLERWRAPTGAGDAWHLNCLYEHEGRLVASAFGRFDHHRGWAGRLEEQHGIVFDWESGADLVTGIDTPHHPRFVDGAWVVCEARPHFLSRADPATGRVVDRLALRGFLRGLAVGDDVLYVGESAVEFPQDGASRPAGGSATIAVVDRRTWQLIDRLPIDAHQLYDLVLVPPQICDAVAIGFVTAGQRARWIGQNSLFASAGNAETPRRAVGEPLNRGDSRVRIEGPGTLAEPLRSGSSTDISVTVTNNGTSVMPTAPPCPVNIGCVWRLAGKRQRLQQDRRTPLPKPLAPGRSVTCRAELVAPRWPGRYQVRVTLVQEEVRWFDQVDATNALELDVVVTGPRPSVRARVRRAVAGSPRLRPLAEEAPRLKWLLRNLLTGRGR